jgi:hypothetical protein
MKITDKDQLSMNDRATLSFRESQASGPVIEIRRRGDAVIWVRLAGHPAPFMMVQEAVTAEEWGQYVWRLQGAERFDRRPQLGDVGTARVRVTDTPVWHEARGTWVRRKSDSEELAFRLHEPIGHVGMVRLPFIMDYKPDATPDFAAAVDAYARKEQRLGVVKAGWHSVLRQAPSATISLADVVRDIEKATGR